MHGKQKTTWSTKPAYDDVVCHGNGDLGRARARDGRLGISVFQSCPVCLNRYGQRPKCSRNSTRPCADTRDTAGNLGVLKSVLLPHLIQGFASLRMAVRPERTTDCSVTVPESTQTAGRTHEVAARNRAWCLCLPRLLLVTFSPASLERLYQNYFRRQRQDTLLALVVFAALFNGYVIVMCAAHYSADKLATVAHAAVALAADIGFYALCRCRLLPDAVMRDVVPYVSWAFITVHVLCYLGLNFAGFYQPSDSVGWQTFFTFSFFLTLPLPLLHVVLLTALSCAVHTVLLGVVVTRDDLPALAGQLVANVMLYLGAMVVGVMSYFMADRKYRTAFLEAKQSLEVRLTLEEQSQQQTPFLSIPIQLYVAFEHLSSGWEIQLAVRCICEELLLSILPKHIADEMLQGMKKEANQKAEEAQQFNTMYMYRHENVRYVREKTQTGVDMRVGVHTGTVLGGVLGQKRWQFDVWSTDVTVANKMESGGIPGRVHISQATMECLHGEFELEPGNGGERCEYLMEKGIDTYLVLVPKETTTVDRVSNGVLCGGSSDSSEADGALSNRNTPLLITTLETNGSVCSVHSITDDTVVASTQVRLSRLHLSSVTDGGMENEQELNRQLNKALLEREMEETVKEKRTAALSLRFVDSDLEWRYSAEQEHQSGVAFCCSCVVLFFTSIMEVLIDPQLTVNYVTLAVGEVLLLILTICSLAAIFPRVRHGDDDDDDDDDDDEDDDDLFSGKLVSFSMWIDRTRWARNTWAMAAIFVLTMAEVADMLSCVQPPLLLLNTSVGLTLESRGDGGCAQNPKHYSFIAVLSLVATTMLVQVSHLVKLALMLLVTVATSAVDIYSWRDIYDIYDLIRYLNYRYSVVPSKYLMTVMIIVMMISFYYFARHVERQSRKLFLWKIEVHEQKERVYEMRTYNEALVTNMLPEHVAKHFLGSKKRDEELYSQSYDEIGVMFASIPNFSDFYTEETINNGGIECLRILNEIISDFDSVSSSCLYPFVQARHLFLRTACTVFRTACVFCQLLDRQEFRCITKIKTIGSTYMAASGVTPESNTNNYSSRKKEDQCILERWQHLADLADFALAMKVTLNNLNKQSFNNFMLRIGLNMGGVLAGVIGARKPHYDIWGNTVNVASRMESTGVMGNIQVVEDCYRILQEYGFRFVRRGPIFVKGKGELLTYFMKGKDRSIANGNTVLPNLPHQIPDRA
ncbi:hypothetical protein P4O66_019879 [Electrophorus voltai]|uniref:adenylate cyclase n=1 Tax=Electrophorus voltai TaxID=2609070 RepID=A0AAD8ZUR9_9TELE|nr:hypothetical protein P4O66_019879 [Electrophorus voltai]